MPIGNITSQIFANIYLNKLDWFIKQNLGVKHYFRYADDFVIVHTDTKYLKESLNKIQEFLEVELDLELHPDKIFIRKFRQGIDFLGYVILPHYIVLRTKTKQRMFKKMKCVKKNLEKEIIDRESFEQSLQSYLGMLKHCDGHNLAEELIYELIQEQ